MYVKIMCRSGLFSTLTDDVNALCLFVIENVSGNEGVVGDMPRGKQFGYLFSGATPQTIAHEIGHGLFHLDHPFDRTVLSKSFDRGDLADNLMEYGNGTNLVKLQWDAIHAPGLVIGVFETDESGMRKGESERSQITRFMYALRDGAQNEIGFQESEILTTKDKTDILNVKKDYSVKADHIFYDEFLSDYFEEVELKLFFDAKKRLKDSPNELFFLRQINKITYSAWYVENIDAVIAFIFKKEQDIPKFNEFIGEKDALTLPVSSVRKAFFIHGTTSDNERWLEHPLTERVLLFISNTDTYDDKFSWKPYSDNLLNDMIDRNKSAQELVDYVITNSQGFNEIVLIGHSHGGNVALQAVNQLVDKGKTVYLISVSTPAYNGETVKVFSKNTLQNCEYLHEYIITSPSITGMTQTKTYEYKNPENPKNTKLKQHLHLWNKEDGVAGGLAGDDYYKSNGITENIEIMTDREYSESIISLTYTEGIKIGSFMEFINAHGFDANRPQLIYKMLLNNKIKPIQ